jgi:hypothetical protein
MSFSTIRVQATLDFIKSGIADALIGNASFACTAILAQLEKISFTFLCLATTLTTPTFYLLTNPFVLAFQVSLVHQSIMLFIMVFS